MKQIATYILPPVCGYIPNTTYEIEIKEDDPGYFIHATYDVTNDKEVDLVLRLSSKVSIDRYFTKEV